MTIEEFNLAKEKFNLIKESKDYSDNINNLLKRAKEITGSYTKYIKIRLAEQYVNTPQAEVSWENFQKFLVNEIALRDRRTSDLEGEFAALKTGDNDNLIQKGE